MHDSASTTGGPIWDLAEKAPLFDRKPTITAATSAATKSVRTVVKLGDWLGDMENLEYPVQIIDAIRDIVVNVVYRAMMAKMDLVGTALKPLKTPIVSGVLGSVADESLLKSFQVAKVAPTSWASRICQPEIWPIYAPLDL
jgi:hypothetical protein